MTVSGKRLRILTWHVHGSYLDALTSVDHDWFLPVKEGSYRGRRWSSPPYVYEVPAEEVRELELDLVIYQSARNWLEDQEEILSAAQRELPRIYLEHNVPRPHATDTRHVLDDPRVLLVHVTHYNQLMWASGEIPTRVIEHSVAIDRSIRCTGELARGITMINGMQHRPRITGLDLFLAAREQLPLDLVGMETEEVGGRGDIPYRDLHRHIAPYRLLFSPIRYTSLPLAVIEAMTIGMPVVALATTELPTVIENGVSGYVSCDHAELLERMAELLADREAARRMGANAREVAMTRFSLDRFIHDWHAAFERAIELQRGSGERNASPSRREEVAAAL